MNFACQSNMTDMDMHFGSYENSVDMTNVSVIYYFYNPNENN